MKKECTKYQSMVEPFLEGKLSGSERQSFVEHIKHCKVCHEELEIYHVIYSVMDELDNESEQETTNYMATLERKLGNSGKSDKNALYTTIYYIIFILGIAAIVFGLIILFG